jgi:hypothetical protein
MEQIILKLSGLQYVNVLPLTVYGHLILRKSWCISYLCITVTKLLE